MRYCVSCVCDRDYTPIAGAIRGPADRLTRYIDVHSHIDQHSAEELPGIVSRARSAGVRAIITSGVTVESSARCVQIAHEYETVFAGVGVHPEDMTGPLTPDGLRRLGELAADPRVVVMSEVGLDHSPPDSFRPDPGSAWRPSTGPEWSEAQEEAFRVQLGIAREQGLAVVFHNRGATEDTLRVLRDESRGGLTGAAHYFQGDWHYASALLDLGFYISVAKPLLRSRELQDVISKVPLERLVLETDSCPQRYKRDRTKWTEPKDLPTIAEMLAELHGLSLEEVRDRTTENALRMLGKRAGPVRAELDRQLS